MLFRRFSDSRVLQLYQLIAGVFVVTLLSKTQCMLGTAPLPVEPLPDAEDLVLCQPRPHLTELTNWVTTRYG
jgi:hypothetical protein